MKMKAALILVIGYMVFFDATKAQNSTSSRNTPHEPKVNVGIKTGFNSTMFFIERLTVGGQKLEHLQNNYKVGYLGAMFVRFNIKRHHFLQTEFSYNVSKGSISAAATEENINLLKNNALVKTENHSIAIPLLYGYKFIDSYPYQMSFFVGPQIAWSWKKNTSSDFSGFYQQSIRERFHPLTYSMVAGLAVNITNIFFDFRYEAGVHNLTRSITFDSISTENPYNEQELSIIRRRNVLSFSLGVIF